MMRSPSLSRRTFLGAAVAIAAGAKADLQPPETLTQWIAASQAERARGVRACLARIRELDPTIHAWVQVRPQNSTGRGDLAGIPFGVKDIVETRGLVTEYGSPIYKGRVGTTDASIVSDLKQRGAVLVGKTQTTAFAYRTPPPTRNPRELEHTPGGSSSGSAAAVAAGMVPFAVGEQTLGSVLRPASYCGVTGFKPTYGLLSMQGVMPLAHSLDTLGFFTHTPGDMLALWRAVGQPGSDMEPTVIGVPEPALDVESEMATAYARTISVLRAAGVKTMPLDIRSLLTQLVDAARTVMFFEGARFHAERYKQYGDRLGDLASLVREGLQMTPDAYAQSKQVIAQCKDRFDEIYQKAPFIVVPAATGPAPLGLAFTGDTRMNSPWTALGVPAISIPMTVHAGLPLGLQLTANRNGDSQLLRAAVEVQSLLGAQT
jgi:Asp-tRNA(Asn)/Glu-tRNA(Gln) amidotransferase A subunit family amidase